MTKSQIQEKLDQLAIIANELVDEAKLRYGKDGHLFFESEGTFHLMSGDEDPRSGANHLGDRQLHVVMSSNGYCRMGCGAW